MSSTYARFAAVALPPLVVAVGYLVYRDLDRLAHEPPRPIAASPPATAPASAPAPPAAADTSAVFEGIYRDASWGKNAEGEASSGSGSTLESTALYRAFLQAFLKKHRIKSVVDAGCGDWAFSKEIDWTGVDYKGYDIAPSVIAKNKARYEAPNVHFFVANIVTADLPAADLVLSKHVLQHLPNRDVQRFLDEQVPKYEHALLTNSVLRTALTGTNRDIAVGEFRSLDPTAPPFGLVHGVKALTWWDGLHMHQVVHARRADDQRERIKEE